MIEVTLLNKPDIPGSTIAGMAAATCVGGDDFKRGLLGAMSSGHESVLEHAFYTFRITGVSRVLLAQLTRHRIASFSVESQRYCKIDPAQEVIIPGTISKNAEARKAYSDALRATNRAYNTMLELGIPYEDARYIAPMCVTTSLIMTMNARELRHFLSLRCCNRAQWEIRALADKILYLLQQEDLPLFRDAGPGCVRGKCPEGSRSCGKPRIM